MSSKEASGGAEKSKNDEQPKLDSASASWILGTEPTVFDKEANKSKKIVKERENPEASSIVNAQASVYDINDQDQKPEIPKSVSSIAIGEATRFDSNEKVKHRGKSPTASSIVGAEASKFSKKEVSIKSNARKREKGKELSSSSSANRKASPADSKKSTVSMIKDASVNGDLRNPDKVISMATNIFKKLLK